MCRNQKCYHCANPARFHSLTFFFVQAQQHGLETIQALKTSTSNPSMSPSSSHFPRAASDRNTSPARQLEFIAKQHLLPAIAYFLKQSQKPATAKGDGSPLGPRRETATHGLCINFAALSGMPLKDQFLLPVPKVPSHCLAANRTHSPWL